MCLTHVFNRIHSIYLLPAHDTMTHDLGASMHVKGLQVRSIKHSSLAAFWAQRLLKYCGEFARNGYEVYQGHLETFYSIKHQRFSSPQSPHHQHGTNGSTNGSRPPTKDLKTWNLKGSRSHESLKDVSSAVNSLPRKMMSLLVGGFFNYPHVWGFPKMVGFPKMDGLWWKTLSKWMIWGYHYFQKHPYMGATPKMVETSPTTMGFSPTKNDHFGVWNGGTTI